MKIKLPASFYPQREYVSAVVIDPGESVGLAIATFLRCGNAYLAGDHLQWDLQVSTKVLNWPAQAVELDALVLAADILVIEEFRLRKDKALSLVGDTLYAPEVIGFIKGQLSANDDGTVINTTYQEPSDKEGLDEYARKRFDWPTTEHERDALRHLVHYLLTVKRKDN